MRGMNVPYRIIQHYLGRLYVDIRLENRMGAVRLEKTGIGSKLATIGHIRIVSPIDSSIQMIILGIGFHREIKHRTAFH